MDDKIIGLINGEIFNQEDLKLTSDIEVKFDSQLNWAILLTLAGYKEKDEIVVNGEPFFDTKKLNEYGSFLLNDLRAAPRKFDINTSFFREKSPENGTSLDEIDTVVSFSGGIDSTAGLLLEMDKNNKILPVWVGFGQKNQSDELAVVDSLSSRIGIGTKKININFKGYVDEGWSRWKLGIIPARNYLFSAFAANMLRRCSNTNNKILICAHKEEITPIHTDKCDRFFETSSQIFSDYYKKNILVDTPFREYTKPEIISYWHRFWENKYGIKPEDTVSCYTGNNCGICKACINRAIAFECANTHTEKFIVNPALDSAGMIENNYLSGFNTLEIERQYDFLYYLKQNYPMLNSKIKNFVDNHWGEYSAEIAKRIDHINSAVIQ